MDKFLGKYRIPSIRAYWWDYSRLGAYFVTIDTKSGKWLFGNVVNGEMQLSEIGEIAYKCWQAIPQHFSFVELGAFVVMPNHVHGIIIISNKPSEDLSPKDTPPETLHATSLNYATSQVRIVPENKNIQMAAISPKSGSLGSVIRSYKSAVSHDARKIDKNFAWQDRYFDSIIFGQFAYTRISSYILNNPSKWDKSMDFHI